MTTSITWKGKSYETPSMETLEDWFSDSLCETPDGETVEHDHPDSWLALLGIH